MAELVDHEILVGTYEEFVLGYRVRPKLKAPGQYELEQSFTAKAHCGPVRCLAAGSKYAVSGGSDEMCKVFDIVKRAEHGTLEHHEGTVSCLATHPATSHLLTASDDNSVAVVRMGSWQVEKTLYKHSAGVTALALHPTGKLAFTAGKDKKLITWNLIKARPAFITNLKGIAEFITVSGDGSRYAVGLHRRVDIYSMESAGVEYTIDLKARPNCLVFLSNETVVVGGESPQVEVHSLIEKNVVGSWRCHEARVRCLVKLSDSLLATASTSDNMIKLWDLSGDLSTAVPCVASVDTSCRVTCMTVWHPGLMQQKSKKRPREGPVDKTVLVSEASSPKKKIKPTDSTEEVKDRETVIVEQEQNVASLSIVKVKKKKRKKNLSDSSNPPVA